jgi:hypothetical protein
MSRAPSQHPDDPFGGLLLPISAWKALEDAQITSLEQLQALTPRIDQIRCIDPETAQIIKDRLDRLATRRTVRVRLIFPKTPRRPKGRRGAYGSRRSPS